MRRLKFYLVFTIFIFLIGCTDQKSFEEQFKEIMNDKNSTYKLFHYELNVLEKGDAFAFFKGEGKVWTSYFEKIDCKLIHRSGHGLKLKLNLSLNSTEYYCLAIYKTPQVTRYYI
ncbi:hypothetical protein ACTWP4_12790 [Gracilibacillus sp. D59]|uniref:hypothetical protein n=1 Tax=Gracilibacillus sp. D59 TaxID=3457434 RepID=UPI003FCCCF1E